jgi:transposase
LTVSSSTEDRAVLGLDQKLDAARDAGGPPDEAGAFEGEHHLVHAGRRDLEVPLHVGFRGRLAEDTAIGVDEGQVLTLLVGERGKSSGTRAKQLIHSLIRLGVAIREEARMNIRYHVELSEAERCELAALVGGGKHYARKIKRAQILLAADSGLSDDDTAAAVAVGGSTVYRTKRRFVEGNLEAALNEEPRAGAGRKLTSNEEALLIATACSSPPEGRARWTLELLAGAMVKLTDHDSLSRETVRRRLAENHLKPWQKDMWCIPKVDAEYVARMEDVLDLYAEQPDPKRPVICFDESPTQLIGEARRPIPAAPGRLERFDYEYRRNGAVNLFVFLDAHRSWRRVKVTDHRTADDFALCMRELVDVAFPEAERIRVVLDNLSTHTAAALYAAFPPAEARRVLRRLEFHYTPKHASWLNMVEIEIGVLKGQCLDRRIESCDRLVAEIDVWQSQRNQSGARINWMFSTDKARTKMTRAYPDPSLKES